MISPYETLQLAESRGFDDQTIRQILHLDGGGSALRIRLSNRYGKKPLTVAAARIAVRTEGSGIDEATDTELRFDAATRVTIPVGAEILSDPVRQAVRAGQDLALSLYLPEDTGLATFAMHGGEIGYATPGDAVSAPTIDDAEELATRYFVTGVDVLAPEGTAIAVAFGDSWFEGTGTTPGTNTRFPNLVNARLADAHADHGWVVNQGLSGNRLLTDEIGEHALARLERDALTVPGVTHVLVHFGLNDLGLPGFAAFPEPAPRPTAEALIAGFTTLATRIRAAGLKAIGCTIGPYAGTVFDGYDSPEGQAVRRRVNEWIRTTDVYDAVNDTAAAVADPDDDTRIRPEFNSGDGLHLNDAGARAMAAAIDISQFKL
ncbi:GDSL-type esterase/lipase family protein [Streptomyces sp. NPDC048258]|uniref:GDSL-type esterase/lipase family protein n=1 Tax=Streptomyces sp. NPDC048258 TaxID=3365527 RepID=UPI0037151690